MRRRRNAMRQALGAPASDPRMPDGMARVRPAVRGPVVGHPAGVRGVACMMASTYVPGVLVIAPGGTREANPRGSVVGRAAVAARLYLLSSILKDLCCEGTRGRRAHCQDERGRY
jgi:hypothetical protein